MKKQHYLLATTLIFSASPVCGFNFRSHFQEIEQVMNQMQREIQEAMDNVAQASSGGRKSNTQKDLSLEIKQEDPQGPAMIIVGDLKKPETIEAELNNDNKNLTVTTPNAVIKISAHNNYLAAALEARIEETVEKDGTTSQFVSYSGSQSSMLLEHPVDLEKSTIEYDETAQSLTISLPTIIEKKTGKKVPVTIKNAPTQETVDAENKEEAPEEK